MKKKILLVDDEKSFTNLLKLNLEQTDRYEVRVVNWAEDALPAAREFKPDVMLLDIIMPRMPGGNVVAQFDADPDLKDTPIIFLTAAVQRSRVAEMDGIIAGKPCLAKPATVDEIIDMIEKQISAVPGE
jgi:two-component system, OmpR family, alkaline phosphatase synthesis response regulator PhoP